MGRKSNYQKNKEKLKVELYLSDGVDPGSYTDRELDAEFLDFIDDDGMLSELSDEDKVSERRREYEENGTDSNDQG